MANSAAEDPSDIRNIDETGNGAGRTLELPLRYQRELDHDYPDGDHSSHMRDTASFPRRGLLKESTDKEQTANSANELSPLPTKPCSSELYAN
jgi:hypothetical protein